MCSESNTIANMLAHGEAQMTRLVCFTSDRSLYSPCSLCGACREYLMQFHKDNGQMEIVQNPGNSSAIILDKLLPDWWGRDRFEVK